MADKEWEKAVELRGKSFIRNLETYKLLTRLKPPKNAFDEQGRGRVSFIFFILKTLKTTYLMLHKGSETSTPKGIIITTVLFTLVQY